MTCPSYNNDKLINQTNEITTKVKFRIVTYKEEKTVCENCNTEFYTPEQLDTNNLSMKSAYQKAVN